ncbi:MAG: hypothetical protein SGILL_009090 [Bacillariaceae sp.]
MLLLIFKCFAPADSSNATRWLAGERLQVEEPPDKERKPYQYTEWQEHYQKIKRQLYVFRGIVLFAGLSIVVSAIVMSVGGSQSLTRTLDSARDSVGIVHGLATGAVDIIDRVVELNQNVSSEIFTLLEDVNGMCPNVRDPLCDNLEDLSTCDVSEFFGDEYNEIFKGVLGHFAAGERSVIYQEIIKARDGLSDAQDIAMQIDSAASQFNWAFILSMILSLLLAALCLFIMSSLVFRMPKMMQCMKSRILMPLFVILVIFAYLFSLMFVTASIATADVCVDEGPLNNVDVRVLTLLERFQETLSPIVVEFARFYIQQCPPELLPQELVEQMDYVVAGVPAISQFSSIVRESTDLIQDVCGFSGNRTQTLLDLADTAQVQLCEVADILKQVRLFFQCETWYPLYETTTYDALCYGGTNGFAYIASTQFVIVFMAFVVVSFRTAFWDVQVGDDPDYEDEEEDYDDIQKTGTDETEKDDDRNALYYSGISGALRSASAKRGTNRSHLNSTMNTSAYSNGMEADEQSYSSDPSTQENTDDDGSGDLVLENHHNTMSSSPDENGVEVGHFDNRADAWSIWARQFQRPTGANNHRNDDDSDDASLGEF